MVQFTQFSPQNFNTSHFDNTCQFDNTVLTNPQTSFILIPVLYFLTAFNFPQTSGSTNTQKQSVKDSECYTDRMYKKASLLSQKQQIESLKSKIKMKMKPCNDKTLLASGEILTKVFKY